MMFQERTNEGYKEIAAGIRQKALVYGKKTLLAEFRLEGGATLPRHKHPHEQTGFLVSGRVDLTIGDKTHQAFPGDSWCIPGNIDHHALALEDSVAVEAFSPVREDYLPQEGTGMNRKVS
jgi:quercetin dioxygenase-like cupin family protein